MIFIRISDLGHELQMLSALDVNNQTLKYLLRSKTGHIITILLCRLKQCGIVKYAFKTKVHAILVQIYEVSLTKRNRN